MSALLLTAVGGTRRQGSVALAANHLFALVFRSQQTQRRFHNTTSQAEDFEQGGVGDNVSEAFDLDASVDEARSGVETETSLEGFNGFGSVELGDTSATVDSLDEDLHIYTEGGDRVDDGWMERIADSNAKWTRTHKRIQRRREW